MADKEQVKILKQGAHAWNAWRRANPSVRVDLAKADLSGAKLAEANLIGANVIDADLMGADLAGAHLIGANFNGARFVAAKFMGTNFTAAELAGANFGASGLFETILNNVDLSATIGLANCKHLGPSCVDYRTLTRSQNVPLVFWRGCGLPDALIEYMPSLTGVAIQFFSCFISYSSKDQEFADRLHADLQNKGVRCWFAPHDMRTGDRIRDTVDQQIKVHEKLLLILSDSSVASNWVENEVEVALNKEMDRQTVLFPVRIDAAIEETDVAWAKTIKRTRHITDFSGWKDHDSYQKAFQRILRDLKPQ